MDSTSTLAAAKTAVFGTDPVLGTDGQPLERGVGSAWHRAEHISKAHFHAATAWAACDDLVSAAKSLLASAEKISAACKASIEAAAVAKDEQPVPAHDADFKAMINKRVDEKIKSGQVPTDIKPATPPAPVNLSFDIP
jgi:hypothetical protein